MASRTEGGGKKWKNTVCARVRGGCWEDPDGFASSRSVGFSGFLQLFLLRGRQEESWRLEPASASLTPSIVIFRFSVSAGLIKPRSDGDSITGSGPAPPLHLALTGSLGLELGPPGRSPVSDCLLSHSQNKKTNKKKMTEPSLQCWCGASTSTSLPSSPFRSSLPLDWLIPFAGPSPLSAS